MTSTQRCPWHHSARQHVLLEYATLKEQGPPGLYVASKPGESLQWSGVLFVRKGPYAPAVLRFQIVFPNDYPYAPPTITFSTDIFHPLVIPLTTYTYSTGFTGTGTVSASDDDRLPPGSFSLRHGFPAWFHTTSSSTASPVSDDADRQQGDLATNGGKDAIVQSLELSKPTITEVLDYVRRSFDQDDFLDDVPLDAAGNSGAWKAWRAHRASSVMSSTESLKSRTIDDAQDEWKWDGVWEQRVRRGIDTSVSDAVLFGGGNVDDLPRFLDLSEEVQNEISNHIFTPS